MLGDCISFFVMFFRNFFAWLSQWDILEGLSYLSLVIGAFLVFYFVDNFLLKGK